MNTRTASYNAGTYASNPSRGADTYRSYDSYDDASTVDDRDGGRMPVRDYSAVIDIPTSRLDREGRPAFCAAIGRIAGCHPNNVRILDILDPGMVRFCLADGRPVPLAPPQELATALTQAGLPCEVRHPIRAVQTVPAGESHIVQRMVEDLSRAEGELHRLHPQLRREADARRYMERESDAIAVRLAAAEERARAAEQEAATLGQALRLRDQRVSALESGALQNVNTDPRAAHILSTLRHEDDVFMRKDKLNKELRDKLTTHADTIVHLQGVIARHNAEMAAANAQVSRLDALVAEKERVAYGLRAQLESADLEGRGTDAMRSESDAAHRAADAFRREAAATAAERDELAKVADDAVARARAAESRAGRLAGEVDRMGGDSAALEKDLAKERVKRQNAEARIDALEKLRLEQRRTVGLSSDALREKDSTIALLEDRVAHAAAQASSMAGDLAQRDARIRSLEAVVHEYRSAADGVADSIRSKDREVEAMRKAVDRHVAANEALEAERDRLEAIAREARRQAAAALHGGGPGTTGGLHGAVQRLSAAMDDAIQTAQRAGAGGPPPAAVSGRQMLADGAEPAAVLEHMAPQVRYLADTLKGVLGEADETRAETAAAQKAMKEMEGALHRAETAARRAAPLSAGVQAAEARVRDLEEALDRARLDADASMEEAAGARDAQKDADAILRQRERLLDQLAGMLRTACRRHGLLGTMSDAEVGALGVRELLSTVLTHLSTASLPAAAPDRARDASVGGIAAGPRMEHGDRMHRLLVDIASQLVPRPANSAPYSELGATGLANLMDDAAAQLRNLIATETKNANRVAELEQRLAGDDYHKTMRNINHPQMDWVMSTRGRLVRGIWALYNDLKTATLPANMSYIQQRAGPRGADAMGHVEAARARAHALVCSYVTESEKMQVGIPKALFPPVDTAAPAPPTLTDEDFGANAQRVHTDRVRRAQLSGVIDPDDAAAHTAGVASGRGSATITTPAAARRMASAGTAPKAASAMRGKKMLTAPPVAQVHPGEAFGLASVDPSVDDGPAASHASRQHALRARQKLERAFM